MTVNYGREISCTDSLRTGRYVTGVTVVAQACYRRLITPRGRLRGGEAEAEYGFDITSIIGSTSVKALEASLPARIETELRKDERIESVSVDVLSVTTDGETTFTITIDAVTGAGPFSLQLDASAVTVELLGISEDA